MFAELPKLFDRDFAIGYFLPLATFVAAAVAVASAFGIQLLPLLQLSTVVDATILVIALWLGGVLLLAVNRDLVRLMEGYWPFGLVHRLNWIEKRRYRKMEKRLWELKKSPQGHQAEMDKLALERAERFPDDEEWVLPTSFGNTIRAFEVYPRVMYGLDAIPGWDRLVAVISKDFSPLVDSAKAQVDFCVNVTLFSLLVLVEYVGLAVYTVSLPMPWIPFVALAIAYLWYTRARNAALEWGNLVRASFDVYLDDLRSKLGFASPQSRDEERELWEHLSKAIIYRLPEWMPRRDPKRPVDTTGNKGAER